METFTFFFSEEGEGSRAVSAGLSRDDVHSHIGRIIASRADGMSNAFMFDGYSRPDVITLTCGPTRWTWVPEA